MGVIEINNEKVLIKQLALGSESAFQKLFDSYYNIIYKYSLSMVGSKPHAEEIVQEVFLKLWLKRESLNPELSFKSFLFTITKNQTITFLKKAARVDKLREEVFFHSQKFISNTELHINEQEIDSIKREALGLYPSRRRLIFEMSRYEGKSYEEIANELGISKNTVKNQMNMALETLRDFLLKNKDIALMVLLIHKNWL